MEKDLKGAFNLLNYHPDYCKWFAFPLIDDIVVIHLAGLFGWIGNQFSYCRYWQEVRFLARCVEYSLHDIFQEDPRIS